MKNKLFIFVVFIVIGELFYQLGYKYVPLDINPLAVIFAVYVIGSVFVIIGAHIFDKIYKQKSKKFFVKSKTPYIFAASMLGFDMGYLLIYRIGGEASKVFNLSVPLQAIALAIAGAILYKEKLNKNNMIGIVLSILGVVLITM